jgi:hypothetical protein
MRKKSIKIRNKQISSSSSNRLCEKKMINRWIRIPVLNCLMRKVEKKEVKNRKKIRKSNQKKQSLMRKKMRKI